jgi:hypothetical protein
MRVLLALAALLLAGQSFAQSNAATTLWWQHDGKNTDGSTSALTGFRVYYGQNGALTNTLNVSGASARTATLSVPSVGLWEFQLAAVGTNGAASTPTAKWQKLVVSNPPTTPAVAIVTVAGPVFNLAITTNSLVVLEAGAVAAGVPCDATQQVAFAGKSYMRVDAARVTAFPGQQILAAWATCQ